MNRRKFLTKVVTAGGSLLLGDKLLAQTVLRRPQTSNVRDTVYRAVNGSPRANMEKVIDLMGGIQGIIGKDDVVVIKPNVQWWNQGAPNIAALEVFVDVIMNRPGGFQGEVVLAENTHRGAEPWKSTGWAYTFKVNSDAPDINTFGDLSNQLKGLYGKAFTVAHLIDVDAGGKRVYGPKDAAGYVYCDGTNGIPLISYDNGFKGTGYRTVIMNYPIIKTDKGTIVDFKNGIWEKGGYSGRPLKFINFSALNHHSTYCGATSAIKNYLGVTDLSGGPDPVNGGRLTGEYFNFHSFPFNKWAPGPVPGMIGAQIAVFMKTIRKADLNITTAEWVGLGDRTEAPIAHTRTILASTDPVALDYHAFKYLLYPNSKIAVHNPEHKKSPVHQYLKKCSEMGGGVFDEAHVEVKSYDLKVKRLQRDEELKVLSEIEWGTKPKSILKYLALRYVIG